MVGNHIDLVSSSGAWTMLQLWRRSWFDVLWQSIHALVPCRKWQLCYYKLIPILTACPWFAAQLAIQERDWKKKRAELKRRVDCLQAMNVKAREMEKALQDANKKLKERLRSLHGVFEVGVTVQP